jgi:AcrR family transcriptional regulator
MAPKSEGHKIDRRVRRTRRLLKDALLELVQQKNYEKITIRDVTDQADIGYATFFRHYDGIDDLMLEIFTLIIEELEALPEKHAEDYFKQEGVYLFEHILENQWLYRAILDSHTFTRRLSDHVGEMMLGHLQSHSGLPDPNFPYQIAAVHMVSSLLGLINWWLDSDHSIPVESMAEIYDRLIVRATWWAITPGEPLKLPWEESGIKK